MKKIPGLFILLSLLICCDNESRMVLNSAESIISSHPDSALTMLQGIDPRHLKSDGTKAKYALLVSAALDKNYIDVDSDSLISKAVTFYTKHGKRKDRMLAWYYQGICLKNAGKQIPSMLAFEKAEKDADDLDEWLYLGLIRRNKAVLFNLSNNSFAAIDNWKKAISCFEKAHADTYKAYAQLSLAIDYSNVKEYDSADSLIQCLRETYSQNPTLVTLCNRTAAEILVKKETTPERALELFRKVPRERFSILDYGYYAQAFEMIGEKDSADYWLNEGYMLSNAEDEKATLDYMRAYLERKRGHEREAYSLIKHAAVIQDSVTRDLLCQSISAAQRDYYKSESLLNEEQLKVMRQKWAYGVMSAVLLIALLMITTITLTRIKDQQLQEQMARRALQELEIVRINRDNAHLIGSLFNEKIGHLDTLCKAFFKSEDGKQKDRIFRQIKEVAANIRMDDDLFLSLENDLNRYCNNIMSKLRKQVPRIKGENLRIILLFFAGFSYETVYIILNKNSIESLKTARSRYRKEIIKSEAPDATFFLSMLEMKKRPQAGTNE